MQLYVSWLLSCYSLDQMSRFSLQLMPMHLHWRSRIHLHIGHLHLLSGHTSGCPWNTSHTGGGFPHLPDKEGHQGGLFPLLVHRNLFLLGLNLMENNTLKLGSHGPH